MIIRGFCAILMVAIATVSLSDCVHADDYAKMKKMDEVSRQIAKERNQEILFYGKVIDFDGAPVVEANVKMHIRIFGARKPQNAFKDVNVTTDDNGVFSVVDFGELITVDDIIKEGYVYHYKYNRDRSRWSVKAQNRKSTGFERDTPMTFRILKNPLQHLSLSVTGTSVSVMVGRSGWTFIVETGHLPTACRVRN